MNLTLVFSRKYRWPEHYFSVWSLGNSQKLLTANQFLISTIFFTIMKIPFFSLRLDLFSIIAKEVDQIRNNGVCVLARFVFLFCCALTTGRCIAFQHIFVNLKKSEFYGPYFQIILFLVTMLKLILLKIKNTNNLRFCVTFEMKYFHIMATRTLPKLCHH